ncbi:MAG: hypothetical protein LH650_01095 [Chloroflexi bacterium]|nr:hypothetical protein [Chloroflexota bacterium]
MRAFVAENVTPETYAGILKGARGALLTGAANSADSALLMEALLRAGAPDARIRFATCELDAVALHGSAAAPVTSALDDADAIAAEIDDPGLRAAILALRDYRARTKVRTAESALALETALMSGVAPWTAAVPSAPTPMEHVWVQVEQAGTWTDEDPTTASGVAPCSTAATMDTLPVRLSHRVRFHVTIERQVAGGLQTATALEAEFRTASLAASRIAFGFAEPIGLIERPVDDRATALPYTPVLRIDDASTTGSPIMLPRIVVGQEGVSGFDGFGGFDGSIGIDASPAPEVDPVTGAWLGIEVIAPDGRVISLASEVFDRIGIVARSAGVAAPAVIEPLTEVNGEYAALDTMWQIGLLLGEMRLPDATVAPFLDVTSVDGLSGTMDGLLRVFPAMRYDLGGGKTMPMILLAGMGPVSGPAKRGGLEPGEVVTQLVLDAIHVPAVAPADSADAARDAQAILAAEGMLAAVSGGTIDPLGDAGLVFQAAAKAATPMLTLVPGDTPSIAGASPAALARITARLRGGYTLLTPAIAPALYGTSRTAWWYIDPATGVVRDEHENGRHAETAEYGGVTARTTSKWQKFCDFAWRMRLPISISVTLLAGATGFEPKSGGALFKAMAKTGSAAYQRKKTADDALKLACPGEAKPGPPLP